MKLFTPLSILIIMAALSGCSHSTEIPPNNSALRRPGVGSMFIYERSQYDSNGVLTHLARLDTFSVIASGITFGGKTNVVQMAQGADPDVRFFNYEPNGDLSFYANHVAESGYRSGWMLIPLASKGMSTFNVYDSTYLKNGASFHRTGTATWTYTGSGSITAAGRSFDVYTTTLKADFTNEPNTFTESSWWAPEIGTMVKDVTTNENIEDRLDLVSYVLR